ncbi:MAG: cupin [Alphaproteobacteria bacterium]|nr:cupin [Alphaproteobacteria bacterium]
MTADEIIRLLDLQPHPEGGHFRETFRDPAMRDGRTASTAIYYLLRAGESSHWHRVDAAEVWHFYAGDPLELLLSGDEATVEHALLGTDLSKQQRPQIVVPARVWQSAKPLGAFTLVGCTVAPGFEFKGFEMAAPNWSPGPRR